MRLVGWFYVAVLVPVALVVAYLAVHATVAGGDVRGALQMFPLALIWPLAALALRGQSVGDLVFPLNVLALAVCAAFVISGWTVLVWAARDVLRFFSERTSTAASAMSPWTAFRRRSRR